MRALFTIKAIKKILFNAEDATYTIPILVDSTAAIAMNVSENPTRRTRHITTRFWFGKQAEQQGHVLFVKVDGNTQQIADMGTKNLQAREARYYRYLFEGQHEDS